MHRAIKMRHAKYTMANLERYGVLISLTQWLRSIVYRGMEDFADVEVTLDDSELMNLSVESYEGRCRCRRRVRTIPDDLSEEIMTRAFNNMKVQRTVKCKEIKDRLDQE